MDQEEANLITFTPIVEQQVSQVQGVTGIQEQPKRQRSPRKKKNSEWTLNQKQFDHSKTQEISHILPGEHLNVFNGEESVSYLQLPVKKKEENRFCTRCGEMGHERRYCQANTWCKFCTMDTHATQACRKYEKFVKDNPIASSRRNTPEKRDLDPALLVIPTFSGEAKDRPQCLDRVSRVKNVCDQSGHSFRQELINKSGILVQNFIRSLNENITNNELTEKILTFRRHLMP